MYQVSVFVFSVWIKLNYNFSSSAKRFSHESVSREIPASKETSTIEVANVCTYCICYISSDKQLNYLILFLVWRFFMYILFRFCSQNLFSVFMYFIKWHKDRYQISVSRNHMLKFFCYKVLYKCVWSYFGVFLGLK